MAKQNHYVDNKLLFETLVKYKKAVARQTKNPPPIPEYVGECLLKIATRLSQKSNFASYTFRDDMISDAIENCIMYLHNFDPAKSSNPFAYFTQITHFAFIRRIEREKKQVYTKLKYAIHRAEQQEDYIHADGDSADLPVPEWTHYENIREFIRDYEHKLVHSRSAAKTAAVEPDSDSVVSFDLLDEEPLEYEQGVDGKIERLSDETEEGDDSEADESE